MLKRMLVLSLSIAFGAMPAIATAEPEIEVVRSSDVTLQPLNPLRGDASPKAGVLWGDIKKNIPAGTLLQFADGFSSPPHIHNITYRAVVISGAIHNDDPAAARFWMEPGSFWTQPAGETHITAAKPGAGATAFLEILAGPYLVQPADQEFDNRERPINLEARNVVWLDAADANWIDQSGLSEAQETPEIAYLWGRPEEGQLNGTFLKLPAGFQASIKGNDAWLRAVLTQGTAEHQVRGTTQEVALDTGSYFGSKGAANHSLSCTSTGPCVLYIRTEGKYEVSGN